MKYLIAFLLVFITLQYTQAQPKLSTKSKKAVSFFNTAFSHYKMQEYDQAADFLLKALDKDEKFYEARLMLAEVYLDDKKHDKAIAQYQLVINQNTPYGTRLYFYIANAELEGGKYADALTHYQQFLDSGKDTIGKTDWVKKRMERCKFCVELVQNPVPFHPQNMGKNINSKYYEYTPAFTVDGKTIIFTRLVPVTPEDTSDLAPQHEDFYTSTFDNDTWSEAQPMSSLNTLDNEGAQSITADGNEMVFTACNRFDGMGSCDIYYTRKQNGKWLKPVNMGFSVNSGGWDSQPSISPDGQMLFFASNRPGGKGKSDIWICTRRTDGQWNMARNLGDSINTTNEEKSPFMYADGRTLYFASDGHLGLGESDLFWSHRIDKRQWTKPKNLGYPINTYQNEISLAINARGDKAFFSSDRSDSYGDLDIYSFDLPLEVRPTPVTYVKGTVFDASNKQKLRALCQLTNLATGDTVMQPWSDASTGEFMVCLPIGRNYALNISLNGYLFYSANFSLAETNADTSYHLEAPLQPIIVGSTTVLRNIFFDTDSYQLLPESVVELQKLIDFLNKNNTLHVQISGHTDNVGDLQHNNQLSNNRAKAVYDYLTGMGIDPTRLSYAGYGFSRPIADNSTPEGRAENRRIEFTIVKK